jgi:hypothetical protein
MLTLFFSKAHVKGHTRRVGGQVIQVQPYDTHVIAHPRMATPDLFDRLSDGRPRTAWLAARLGLGKRGDRTVRGWLAGIRNGQPAVMPYSVWFALVEILAPGAMQRK